MTLKYKSKRGDIFDFTDNPYVYLINADGQTTATASLSSSTVGGIDGDNVTSLQAIPRTIILDLAVKQGTNVEEAKREILRIVKLKQRGSLIWEQNLRTLTISGIVESVDMPRYNNQVTMQITLHCEQPFWEDVEQIIEEINEFIDMHYFTSDPMDMLYFPSEGIPLGAYDSNRTKTFYNSGDVDVGMTITIKALGWVTNPIIYDTDGNFFGVGYGSLQKRVVMEEGDEMVITTHKGNKTVKLNGVSMFDKIKPQSKWLQLEAGENQLAINSDDEATDNMAFYIAYTQRYI